MLYCTHDKPRPTRPKQLDNPNPQHPIWTLPRGLLLGYDPLRRQGMRPERPPQQRGGWRVASRMGRVMENTSYLGMR